MGWTEYEPIAARYQVPIVVTGFEPVDILEGIALAVRQLEEGRHEVENQYVRAVRRAGTPPARDLVFQVFELADRKWRGIGKIPRSGLALRPEFADFDAELRFGLGSIEVDEPAECRAGEVLRGTLKPLECPAFGTLCTPEHPLGAPMVSSEGACAAYYNYRPPPRGRRAGGTEMTATLGAGPACPVPLVATDRIQLGHGSGGKMSAALLRDRFLPHFGNPALAQLGDAAVLPVHGGELAISTDTFVVHPVEFPGGNIGSLSVHGTLNDLAMMGARPLYLTAGFVLEEGLDMALLDRVVARDGPGGRRRRRPDRHRRHQGGGAGQGRPALYQHHRRSGLVPEDFRPAPDRARAGDVVLVSGPDRLARDGDHGGARGDRVRGGHRERLRHPLPAGRAASRGRRARPSTCCAIPPAAAWRARSTKSRRPPGSASCSTTRSCRCRGRSPRRATCSGSTSCMWPTKASWWRSSRPMPPTPRSPRFGATRSARRRSSPAPPSPRIRAWWCSGPASGGTRIVDMLPGDQLPRIC